MSEEEQENDWAKRHEDWKNQLREDVARAQEVIDGKNPLLRNKEAARRLELGWLALKELLAIEERKSS